MEMSPCVHWATSAISPRRRSPSNEQSCSHMCQLRSRSVFCVSCCKENVLPFSLLPWCSLRSCIENVFGYVFCAFEKTDRACLRPMRETNMGFSSVGFEFLKGEKSLLAAWTIVCDRLSCYRDRCPPKIFDVPRGIVVIVAIWCE